MKTDGLISVIVPVYNVEKYLERCIDSIIDQTYKNIEIIIVNDGSTDNCASIIKGLQEKDSRIKSYYQANAGLSAARNTGIENSSGDYYLFVDSDDYIHPQMVEILYKNLIDYEADLSVCDLHWIEEGKDAEEYVQNNPVVYSGKEVLRKLIGDDLISVVAWNKLYKKEIFKDIRYPVGRLHEDEFVIHKILSKCNKSVYTDAKLYYYIKRKGSIVRVKSAKNMEDALIAFCERLAWAFPRKDKAFTDWCFNSMLGEANYIIDQMNVNGDACLLENTRKHVEKTLNELSFSLHFTWRKLLVCRIWLINPALGNKIRYYLHC